MQRRRFIKQSGTVTELKGIFIKEFLNLFLIKDQAIFSLLFGINGL